MGRCAGQWARQRVHHSSFCSDKIAMNTEKHQTTSAQPQHTPSSTRNGGDSQSLAQDCAFWVSPLVRTRYGPSSTCPFLRNSWPLTYSCEAGTRRWDMGRGIHRDIETFRTSVLATFENMGRIHMRSTRAVILAVDVCAGFSCGRKRDAGK